MDNGIYALRGLFRSSTKATRNEFRKFAQDLANVYYACFPGRSNLVAGDISRPPQDHHTSVKRVNDENGHADPGNDSIERH